MMFSCIDQIRLNFLFFYYCKIRFCRWNWSLVGCGWFVNRKWTFFGFVIVAQKKKHFQSKTCCRWSKVKKFMDFCGKSTVVVVVVVVGWLNGLL